MEKWAGGDIERFEVDQRRFYVKRDDLIHPLLSGNKYWKLYALIHTPPQRYRTILSYGGTQSNAMLSIAALCQQKGWAFRYVAKVMSTHLRNKPSGNLKMALSLGMQLQEVAHDRYQGVVASLVSDEDAGVLLLPQGGADPLAAYGMMRLANEVKCWQAQQGIETLRVVTPSGTGTTAYYLACAQPDWQVVTTAVVGDAAYLRLQMEKLGAVPQNITILEPPQTYHFAKPYPELLAQYEALKQAGIVFDLIYGSVMWRALLHAMPYMEGDILYLHSGGLMGQASMLERYQYHRMV